MYARRLNAQEALEMIMEARPQTECVIHQLDI